MTSTFADAAATNPTVDATTPTTPTAPTPRPRSLRKVTFQTPHLGYNMRAFIRKDIPMEEQQPHLQELRAIVSNAYRFLASRPKYGAPTLFTPGHRAAALNATADLTPHLNYLPDEVTKTVILAAQKRVRAEAGARISGATLPSEWQHLAALKRLLVALDRTYDAILVCQKGKPRQSKKAVDPAQLTLV